MLFKQIQLFQLATSLPYSPEELAEQLQPLAFKSCLPSLPSSMGWVAPLDMEGAPLVHAVNGYIMICLQIEEKILPATVIRHELHEKIKQRETAEDRKIRQKEKLILKDEITTKLLSRAFSKYTRLYAYIDTKKNRLIINSTNATKIDQFIMLFGRALNIKLHPFDLNRLSPIITHWLKDKSYPQALAIEKSAVLQDPNQQTRIIRCQQQDLFASAIQSLIKDGCEVKQLALCWQERVNFVLVDDFSLRSIKFQDGVMEQVSEIEIETKQQQFDTDFFIMTETFTMLLHDLLALFIKSGKTHVAYEPELAIA